MLAELKAEPRALSGVFCVARKLTLVLLLLGPADLPAEADRLGLQLVVLATAALSASSVRSEPSRLADSWLLHALMSDSVDQLTPVQVALCLKAKSGS